MSDLERLRIVPQPDDSTCGPTCLHAVYDYYDDPVELETLLAEVPTLASGGTLAVLLGCHALKRGYAATVYTYNLRLFDPTWFRSGVDLDAKLVEQAARKADPRLTEATPAYREFLRLGGRLRYVELSGKFLRRHLRRGAPLVTGLSATYLYECARESGEVELEYDDVGGDPVGHFVVLCGYDRDSRSVRVADPQPDAPRYGTHYYEVGIDRVIGAILLGVLTHDANLLLVEPRDPDA